MSTKVKILLYGLLVIGAGILTYSVFQQSTPLMITGFGIMLLSFFGSLPFEFKQIADNELKQKEDFNKIIDFIKDDKLKDAYDLSNEKITGESTKKYIQGLIFGTKFKGDELDQLKFEFKKK